MITIESNIDHNHIYYKHFFFGGGEQHVQLNAERLHLAESVTITLPFMQDSEIIKLALIVDALRRAGCKSMCLKIPYFPAARQDRVCNEGEPLSVKVYADLINAMKFDRVVVFDPHSDVTPALLNNVEVVDNCEFVAHVFSRLNGEIVNGMSTDFMKRAVLVSPDAGSNKKVANVAKHLYKNGYKDVPVVRADKLRNVATGEIIETTVYADDLTDKHCIIVDDICSKGGTFCALAKVLKAKGAEKVYLVVSHYEGTATLRILKESGIDGVFTTNSKEFADRSAMLNITPIISLI
jgi:ribose-phosphate pyrophosphokinase